MLYDNAQLLGVYARWWRRTGDPLAARVARETADFLLAELRTDEGGFASALDADTEGVEGRFYVWTPAELADVLGAEDGRWAAGLLAVTETGTFEHGTSTLRLREDPDDPERWAVAARPAARGPLAPASDRPATTRWSRPGTGWRSPSLAEAGALLGRAGVRPTPRSRGPAARRRAPRRRPAAAGSPATGSPAGTRGCWRTTAASRTASWCCTRSPASRRWVDRAGALLDRALEQFAADDGGFYDTAADAEALVARPRDPTDNASPSGQSALVHALLHYAALTGSGRHRDAAEAALRHVRTLARAGPAVRGLVAGGRRGRARRTARGRRRRVDPGDPGPSGLLRTGPSGRPGSWSAVGPGRDERGRVRCWPTGGWSTGRPRPTSAAGWSATDRSRRRGARGAAVTAGARSGRSGDRPEGKARGAFPAAVECWSCSGPFGLMV